MKVCVVGLGSIGARHILNMCSIWGEQIHIDLLRSGKGRDIPKNIADGIQSIYFSYQELPKDYDAIFITNPTKMHYETLEKCQKHANNFFVEKPIFMTGEENITQFMDDKNKLFYVACPLRYTNVIQYLKNNVDFSHIFSIRCISSSYLPDWRPERDYRSTYSACKALGGGVAIDLIHEWDYLCYLVGQPIQMYSLMGNKSNLEIDSDDIAIYIAEYKHLMVELHLDYFGRVPIRKIELYGEHDTIEADLIEQKIVFKRSGKVLEMKEERDAYQKRELIHFFDIINGKIDNDNDMIKACEILRIARGDY